MLKTFKLKNGIKVATYTLPQLKSVHLRLAAKGGGIMDQKDNNGLAHFLEHMLVQGTPSFPTVEDLVGFVESLAGSYGAHTESLSVNFDITVPLTHYQDAIKIASEVFFEPLFPEAAFEKERQAVQNEIGQRIDSLWYKLSQFFRETRFRADHPLSRDNGGSLEAVSKITKQDVVEFWQTYFLPENVSITMTGNLDQDIKKSLEKTFGSYHQKGQFPGFPKMSALDFTKRQVAIRPDQLQTVYLDLTFPSLELLADRKLRMMQHLCFVILGRLRNSRLFKLLRYQRGLVYGVNAGSSTHPGLGYGYIGSEATEPNLDEVVNLIALELANFVKNGPTQDELDFAKNYLGNQWLMAFDHPSSIAGWIEGDLLWEKKIMLPEESIKMIKPVKVADLVELMQKYWDFKKLNLVIQGPVENSTKNKQKFEEMLNILH